MLHPDGVVLFREPSVTNPINEAAATSAAGAGAAAAGRRLHGPLETGGPTYVSAYRTVGRSAVVVAVSLSDDFVLDDWRRQRRVTATAFGALTLTLGVMVLRSSAWSTRASAPSASCHAVQRLEAGAAARANERLEAALEREQRARQEIEAASYMKDEFLMTVSHELRTPLTAIYGWARVLGTKADGAAAAGARDRGDRAERARADAADRRPARRVARDQRQAARRRRARERRGRPARGRRDRRARRWPPSASSFETRSRSGHAADRRGSGSPAADRVEPALERDQVHARGRHGRLALARAGSHVEMVVADSGGGHRRPTSCRTCSSASARTTPDRSAATAGSGSAWRSSGTSWSCTAARAAESPGEGRGATFRILLPLAVE